MPCGHRPAPTEPAGETIEPMTPCVSDRYSEPTELSSCKWKEKDSNLQRVGLQPTALPIRAIFPKEKPPAFIRQVVSKQGAIVSSSYTL